MSESSGRRSPEPFGIVAAAYELPGSPCDIVEWAHGQNVPDELVEKLLANGCRYFYEGPQHSDAELIAAAIERLDAPDRQWTCGVRYLLHAHTQAFSMPAPPASVIGELVARFQFPDLAMGFSVCQLACASVIHAIDWAVRLLATDPDARYALVVTSDRVFGNAKYRIRQQGGIQSDGGSALLIGRDSLQCRLGVRTSKNFAKLHEGPTTPANVTAISRYTWLHTKQLFQEHSAAAGLPLDEYGAILPINADREYWIRIAAALRLPVERFFLDNIRQRGHACCADLTINLIDHGFAQFRRGQAVLACGQSNIGAYAALTLHPVQGGAG